MRKRFVKKVTISVADENDCICQRFENVNFNSMYDVIGKVRLLESMFELQYKRKIMSFSVEITKE